MTQVCKRSHPISILLFLGDNLYWLLLPLGRTFYTLPTGGFTVWQGGLLFDIAVSGFLILWAYLRWRRFLYGFAEGCFWYRQGVLFVQDAAIPMRHLSAVERDSHILSRLFHLRRIRLYPTSAAWGKPELTFFVHRQEWHDPKTHRENSAAFSASTPSLLLFSLYSSGIYLAILVLSGVLFPKQLPRLASLLFEQDALLTFLSAQGILSPERLYDVMISFLPYPIFALAILWTAVFLLRLDDTFALRASIRDEILQVRRGFLRRRQLSLPLFFLDHLELRQGLFSRCFARCSLYLYRRTDHRPLPKAHLLLPFHRTGDILPQLSLLLPPFPVQPNHHIRPDKNGAVWGYLFAPIVILALLVPVLLFLCYLFPRYRGALALLALVVSVLTSWFFCIRLMAYRSSGVFVHGDVIILRYSFGFTLHTLWFPKTNLLCLETLQHPLQAMSGRCDAILRLTGSPRKTLRVRNLPLQSLRQLQDTLV